MKFNRTRETTNSSPSKFEQDWSVKKVLNGFEYLDTKPTPFGAWLMIFRRDIIADISFNPRIKLHEDGILVLNVCAKCNKIAILDTNVYGYVDNPGSAVHKKRDSEDVYNQGLLLSLELKKYLDKHRQALLHHPITAASLLSRQNYFTFIMALIPNVTEGIISLKKRKERFEILRNHGLLTFGPIIEDRYSVKPYRILRILWKIPNSKLFWVYLSPVLNLIYRLKKKGGES